MRVKTGKTWVLGIACLAIGFGAGFGSARVHMMSGDSIVMMDYNQDGSADAKFTYTDNMLVRVASDNNFDEKMDSFEWWAEGTIQRAEADEDFDGKVDAWLTFESGIPQQVTKDLDGNGQVDCLLRYKHGIPKSGFYRPNGSMKFARAEIYRPGGTLEREYRDTTGDGLFDLLVTYDKFGFPEQNENLNPPMDPAKLRM